MFCPKCQREYREGSYVCTECNIALVAELPPEPKAEDFNCDPELFEFEQLLYTYNVTDIITIKTILHNADIAFFFKEHADGNIIPSDPARLMVRKDHVEDAINLLKDMGLEYLGIDPDEHNEESGNLS